MEKRIKKLPDEGWERFVKPGRFLFWSAITPPVIGQVYKVLDKIEGSDKTFRLAVIHKEGDDSTIIRTFRWSFQQPINRMGLYYETPSWIDQWKFPKTTRGGPK